MSYTFRDQHGQEWDLSDLAFEAVEQNMGFKRGGFSHIAALRALRELVDLELDRVQEEEK